MPRWLPIVSRTLTTDDNVSLTQRPWDATRLVFCNRAAPRRSGQRILTAVSTTPSRCNAATEKKRFNRAPLRPSGLVISTTASQRLRRSGHLQPLRSAPANAQLNGRPTSKSVCHLRRAIKPHQRPSCARVTTTLNGLAISTSASKVLGLTERALNVGYVIAARRLNGLRHF